MDKSPIGTIVPSLPSDYNKDDYLPCDGRPLLMIEHKELYNVLLRYGDVKTRREPTYDMEHWLTVFCLPDLRDSKGVFGYIKVK